MDKTKILRLCNEIEDIAKEIQERTMKDSYFMAQQVINKVLVIYAEVSTKPKTNGDMVRAMTDEELAISIDTLTARCVASHMEKTPCEMSGCGIACAKVKDWTCCNSRSILEWLRKEVSEDAPD